MNICLLILMCLTTSISDLSIFDENKTIITFVKAQLAAFGPLYTGAYGSLVTPSSPYFCQRIPYDMSNIHFISLIKRGECRFLDKVLNAQIAGFDGVIIYDPTAYDLIEMDSNSPYASTVKIPSLFVGYYGYKDLLKYSDDDRYRVMFNPKGRSNFEYYIFVFACVVACCILVFIIFLIVKLSMYYYKMWKSKLPARQIKKLPIILYMKAEDQYFDSCAICLEEFTERTKVRELPCRHIYHVKCIDPWLIKVHRLCPLCKQDVLEQNNPMTSNVSVDMTPTCPITTDSETVAQSTVVILESISTNEDQ